MTYGTRRTSLFAVLAVSFATAGCVYRSPGTLHASSTEPLTAAQVELRTALERDVEHLSVSIGPREAGSTLPRLLETERWLIQRLAELGVEGERDEVDLNGAVVANVVATLPGSEQPEKILLVGAHYDTVPGSPGANDNASGVALLLAAVEQLKAASLGRTVRIVFFVNEENPFSGGIQMGSKVHAERSRERGDDIVAMLAVDSVGYYSSEVGSQNVPAFVNGIPSTGNFLAFVSNREHRPLLDRVVEVFQSESRFPSIGIASDMKDVARSDHAPFWWQGYPALLMSDTSASRDPNYHRPTDTPDQLDYDEFARMAEGFIRTMTTLAKTETTLP